MPDKAMQSGEWEGEEFIPGMYEAYARMYKAQRKEKQYELNEIKEAEITKGKQP